MLNRNALKAEMVRNGYTQKTLAERLRMTERTLSNRMKTGIFSSNEIETMIDVLKLDNPVDIFFAKEVAL